MSDNEIDFAAVVGRFSVGSGREELEDFDLAALRGLVGLDRDHVGQALRERVESGANDPRIVRALVAMQVPGIDALLSTLMHHLDETGVAAASARWQRTGSTDVIEPLVDVLHNPYSGTARLSAAILLGEIGNDVCLAHLGEALDLEEGEVRNVATTALLATVGLSDLERRGRSPISRLGALILNPLAAVRKPAAAELRAIVLAVRGGRSAQSLGLVPDDAAESTHLSDLRESIFASPREPGPWRNALDTNAFRELTGEERERGLQFLLLLIGKRDRRVIPAIVDLQLRSALPALEEAAQCGDSAFKKLAAEAVASLRR